MASENDIELTILERFPTELLECEASNLHTILSGPTLIHIEGRRQPSLFVSVLLHGNETTGWDAVRMLMQHYKLMTLPRSMSLFIGNIRAARVNKRHLSDQVDYNRIWPTASKQANSAENRLAKNIVSIMRDRGVFLSIDIHNNTGLNPHYACVNRLDNDFAYVARLFSKIIIHFTYPHGVQSQAFAEICPSVTIECGQVGFKHGISHAHEFLDTCLMLEHIPSRDEHDEEDIFYENFATIKVKQDVSFDFGYAGGPTVNSKVDLLFYPGLDQYNFTTLDLGTAFAQVNGEVNQLITVTTNDGTDVSQDYFQIKDGKLVNRVEIMPSMLTSETEIVRKDCLCYLMRRILV